ncbi:unnamed protein product [Miscanthus lutarioriparius]|uniref:Uncharacterized protein n=1 Tax=Miscanthus lutarioriparius TaxID=422564 RepID=A0A811PLB3_9POAL|nr:unnamed protein product [Miscanthus lutarioriparius]
MTPSSGARRHSRRSLTAGSDRVNAAKMVSTCRFDASTGKARYGARRLAKPERRPRRAPAISSVECGSGAACASSPVPELGLGRKTWQRRGGGSGGEGRSGGLKRRMGMAWGRRRPSGSFPLWLC